jgi:carotenoid 1,2-hydratase
MTERSAASVRRSPQALAVGPSTIGWQGDALCVEFDEVTVPWPARLRGRVRLHPQTLFNTTHALDAGGRHRWWPVAPCARVEVEVDQPALRWSGHGYHDTNWGDEPLEQGFAGWHWSRSTLRSGDTVVMYDATPRASAPRALALRFTPQGVVSEFDAPPQRQLPTTLWRIPRVTRSPPGTSTQRIETLEDAPFYARSLLRGPLDGEDAVTFHESLSLDRFSRAWVRCLLPFRMPRRPG